VGQSWEQAQEWERRWHGTCQNKVAGEYHQVTFIAPRMGLRSRFQHDRHEFDMKGKTILDIGGGAASLLLQCVNLRYGKVVDPLQFPDWVYARYECADIDWEIKKGEDITETGYDEAWIYNCLQHVEDPHKVILAARRAARLIRIYEYINIGVCDGHIHNLTEAQLNQWLGGEGKTEENQRYFGIFPSNVNTASYWDRIYRREGMDTWRVNTEINDIAVAEAEGSVLELGCGVGVLARRIEGRYVGIDISPVAVQLMKEQGFEAIAKSIPPIGYGTRSFDTVIGIELLEHLDETDRLEVITDAAAIARKKAIFSVPDNCMPPEEHAEHRTMFDEQSFVDFLSLAFGSVQLHRATNFGAKHLIGVCYP
jgi:2-polyprenyl-3-methyl-5-hydroxy-6-metoxy-1,4-benzoquinol methylase